MYSIPFTGDSGLYLTPRFGELTDTWQILVLVLLCLAPLVLTLWLYFYELKLVPRLTAAALLLGRCLVIAALLFLVLFQPVWAQTATIERPGRVLVAVDRSDSMGVTDPQRELEEKQQLAQALQIPVDQIDALTRSEIARRILEDGVHLLPRIRQRHQVELVGFAQDAWDVPLDQLDDLFRPLQTGAAFTDLRLPLDLAQKRSRPDRGPILGLVLLTDGRHNWGPSPLGRLLELEKTSENRVPIFPVAIGAVKPPADVAVVAVKGPPTVFKGADGQVEARVKITGLPAQDVTVELQRPGQEPLVEKIKHDGKDGYQSVRFSMRLDKPGTQTMTVTTKPVPGDTRPENNSRPVIINVADDKAHVLLIDGEARWEWHYLATALSRDRSMQVSSVVRQQPRLGAISEQELQKIGNPALALPTGPDSLAPFDCIILGDVTPEQLSLEDRTRLERYVSDRGGTLVILAGKRAMPLDFLNGSTGDDPLARLLPIEAPQVIKPADGFGVTLTQQGQETAFLQLEAEPEASRKRWAELPRHFWGIVGRAKPGAVTLAYVAEPAAPDDHRKPEERERDAGLVVRHNYGFGRVLFVGLDSTWRWRYKTGDTYHHRFWGQAIRWAAADKPLVAGNESVRFGTREPAYRQRQDVDIVVRLAEDVKPLTPDAIAAARILQPASGEVAEKAVALVPLKRSATQPRLLEGRIGDLLPGRYEIELVIPELADKLPASAGSDGKASPLRAEFAVLAPDGEEMIELALNEPLLKRLADDSGGQMFSASQAQELVELLASRTLTEDVRTEQPLWQWWLPLVLVLGLLSVEWVVRRFSGLP